jgi:hypothetical protein
MSETQHELQFYSVNGPIAEKDGTFTVASIGCSCGWNNDGEAIKTQSFAEHILAAATPAEQSLRAALERITRTAINRGWKIAADSECREIVKQAEEALR